MRSQKNVPEQLKLADFTDKSLLILDDDDPLRGRLARAMEKKGFQVKEAKSVAEGLKIAKTAPTAFAVVDLRLEDGNGLDVVKELSRNKRLQDCYANGLRESTYSCRGC
jgi:two-component system response regulator RegA